MTMTELMTTLEAKRFRIDHDNAVKMLNRLTVAKLKVVYARNLNERGMVSLYGGPASKDELISAIIAFEYPIGKLNESIHVLYHVDGWKLDICEWCK
jgi:hypothetical protein